MALKETPRSLRIYFIVVSLWQGYNAYITVSQAQGSALALALGIANFAISAGFLFAGIRLPSALLEGPGWVLKLLLANGAWIVVTTAILLFYGLPSALVGAALGLLIVWYLYRSVQRLSREAREADVQRVAKHFD